MIAHNGLEAARGAIRSYLGRRLMVSGVAWPVCLVGAVVKCGGAAIVAGLATKQGVKGPGTGSERFVWE